MTEKGKYYLIPWETHHDQLPQIPERLPHGIGFSFNAETGEYDQDGAKKLLKKASHLLRGAGWSIMEIHEHLDLYRSQLAANQPTERLLAAASLTELATSLEPRNARLKEVTPDERNKQKKEVMVFADPKIDRDDILRKTFRD